MSEAKSYALYEMDWLAIEEYMDKVHLSCLHWLCISSYVSPSCLELMVPRVLLLHHLDLHALQIVADMIHEGTHNHKIALISKYCLDPWYSSIYESVKSAKDAMEIVKQGNVAVDLQIYLIIA